MYRNASPGRLLAFVQLLASALSFYLALHMGSALMQSVMLAKGVMVLAGAAFLFRMEGRVLAVVPRTIQRRR